MEFSEGAEAGLKQINTGDSGCPVLKLTEHEVVDLVLSGRAFGRLTNVDGSKTLIEIVDSSKELRKLESLWRSEGIMRTL